MFMIVDIGHDGDISLLVMMRDNGHDVETFHDEGQWSCC